MPVAISRHINPVHPIVFPAFFGRGSDADGSDLESDYAAGSRPHEDLPYKVELWNAGKSGVEVVLAVTANSGIGYAAYHAAAREYPDRYITLRHKNRTIAKINGPEH